jgi:membrane-bound lytic murein transglycosylase A
VPLTAGRSLAVDRRYIPLGVPVWLETTAPWPEGAGPLRRLMVAQDTGGAIKGVVRGDVFFGSGARAEAIAGHMKSRGRYALLLPKALIPVS